MSNNNDQKMGTWGQFKRLVEKAGVRDYMLIEWIDVSYPRKVKVRVTTGPSADDDRFYVEDQ